MALQASDAQIAQIRKEVWNNLYDKDELISPTLPYKLVPIFKGIDAAIEKLLELDLIKKTDKLLLSMEKLLKDVRLRILQEKSVMYVTTYKSSMSTVCKVDAPEKANSRYLRQCSNLIMGDRIHHIAAGEVKFDVLLVSSVAVSESGQRTCKDDILGELEFAILSSLGFVTDDTVVVTLVHDCQVFSKLPESKGPHDLPVDFIVTPTRVIQCPKSSKKTEICWSMVAESQMDKLFILKSLRYNQWKSGKDVRLMGETENPTTLEEAVAMETNNGAGGMGRRQQPRGRRISYSDRKDQKKMERKRKTSTKENGDLDGGNEQQQQMNRRQGGGGFRRGARRFFGRQRRRGYNSYRGGGGGGENFKPAIYVGELPKEWTADEFSDFLSKKDVKAASVVKKNEMTHAFAIFDNLEDVNNCLKHLDGLTLEDRPLKVEISRQTARLQKSTAGGDHPKENGA
ncbi:hypothetical protein HELRODRAFT_195048 [Helobdella robusta]|uniref:Methenyltetrahydrofolate synthase domain-containing protein n=1 Tax=Helobdella robusta TaxID=6412 RepID=T1FWP9_HELRO|nr:hypothetical protein HELRODRAFT_195048 [Helobdella robusta]ESO09661.1 hypothetical protein HELRODRAFT_195048 [Helobdella robusta]